MTITLRSSRRETPHDLACSRLDGGGTVMLWDRGYWEPDGTRTPEQALARGDFKFILEGQRLHGGFVLVRMANDRERGKRTNWLLIKHRDEFAVPASGAAVLDENNTSVASGRPMETIAGGKGRKPKPFMLQGGKVQADAVWDSRSGLAADERKAGRQKRPNAFIARDLPDFLAPQLCETLDRPPSADGWIHEIKFDGYRCHTTFNLKNLKPAISMTYRATRYLINDTLLDNVAHLPTSYLRIVR